MKRRRKPSLLRRLRVFWVFILVGLLAASYGGYVIATWPGFETKTIVVDGNSRVSSDEILARAAVPSDRNIWLLDKRAAEGRIEALPWVKSAQIHRSLPAAVTIVISERTPVACVESANAHYLVDETAHIIATDCRALPSPLAIGWPAMAPQRLGATLEVARLQRLLADARTLQTTRLAPVRVDLDRFDGFEARLQSGTVVRFGADRDLAEKARLVDPILRTYGPHAPYLAVIDLRAPTTPVVEEHKKPQT